MRRHGKIVTTNRDKRPYIVDDIIVKIPLGISAKDGYVTVDREFEYLALDQWRLTHYGYAIRSKDKTLMHRLVTGAGTGVVVDHVNGDKLDNRKSNIRLCSQSQNAKNQKLRVDSKTGYKGVCEQSNKYRARIKHNYRQIELGIFDTAKEAAKAYNKAAKKYHGEYARLNDVLA